MTSQSSLTPRFVAAQNGQSHYEGSPCRKCGGTLRYTVSCNCVACANKGTNATHAKIREILRNAKKGA